MEFMLRPAGLPATCVSAQRPALVRAKVPEMPRIQVCRGGGDSLMTG